MHLMLFLQKKKKKKLLTLNLQKATIILCKSLSRCTSRLAEHCCVFACMCVCLIDCLNGVSIFQERKDDGCVCTCHSWKQKHKMESYHLSLILAFDSDSDKC